MGRQLKRTERRLAREVVQDAALNAGMRRLEFMRAVNNGDPDAMDELRVSLASRDDAGEIDTDKLKEILDMILEFIAALLEIFSAFAV